MEIVRLFGSGSQEGLAATISGQAGQRLSSVIWLSGQVNPVSLCSGLGLCGRCKVRFIQDAPAPSIRDEKFFSSQQLEQGWRLACGITLKPNASLELALPDGAFPAEAQLTWPQIFAETAYVGIDLGTTSIQWQAQSESGATIMGGEELNPQSGAGADIISRLRFAQTPEGASQLAQLAKHAIEQILAKIAGSGQRIGRACIAGNSAMTEILLEQDISGLCAAPWRLAWRGAEALPFRTGFNGDIPIVYPPLMAPFIGGDISAGLLTVQEYPRPLILADLGTNAELALLGEANSLWVTSAPLGPALEGIGPRCGQLAGKNVITGFTLAPNGLEPQFYPDSDRKTCAGISATGYLSLLAILLRLGILSTAGAFITQPQNPMPLIKRILRDLQLENGIWQLRLPFGQLFSLEDMELLLKVKAAFSCALKKLLQASRVQTQDVRAFVLAGALGQYAAPSDLTATGFIPPAFERVMKLVGNASLAGACILAREPERLAALSKLCNQAHILSLTEDGDFLTGYLAEMRWSWQQP